MTFVLDLDAPTYHFEVSVWHYADDHYSVDRDKGHGRATVYQTDSKDKALGVAEYLEENGRISYDSGEPVENVGEPFTGGIVHWDCSEADHPAPSALPCEGCGQPLPVDRIGFCDDCTAAAAEVF